MVECENCKGSGWAWDKHWAKRVRVGIQWTMKECRKWKYCGWCSGTGEIDDWQCTQCSGYGTKSDDSYSTFGCPWCDSKGCRKGAPKNWVRRVWGEGRKPNPRRKVKKIDKRPAEPGDGSRWEEI